MSLVMLLYIANIADGVKGFLCCIGGVATLFGFVGTMILFFEQDGKFKHTLCLSLVGLTMCFTAIFIPNEKTIYVMAAASYGKELSEKPEVKQIGNKILDLINDKLDSLEEKTDKKK